MTRFGMLDFKPNRSTKLLPLTGPLKENIFNLKLYTSGDIRTYPKVLGLTSHVKNFQKK